MEYIGTVKNGYMFTNIVNTDRWFNLEDLPNEIWEDIEGYYGVYQISNKSRVKSKYREYDAKLKYGNVRKVREKILKAVNNGKYYVVRLYKNNKGISCMIHKLMLVAFVPNPENKSQGNHIDGNKLNNDLSNLEWVTPSENIQHAFDTGLKKGARGEKCYNSKLTKEQVKEIRNTKRKGGSPKKTYQKYKDIISFSAFNDVWYYKRWLDVI